jgi:hypothetical protein
VAQSALHSRAGSPQDSPPGTSSNSPRDAPPAHHPDSHAASAVSHAAPTLAPGAGVAVGTRGGPLAPAPTLSLAAITGKLLSGGVGSGAATARTTLPLPRGNSGVWAVAPPPSGAVGGALSAREPLQRPQVLLAPLGAGGAGLTPASAAGGAVSIPRAGLDAEPKAALPGPNLAREVALAQLRRRVGGGGDPLPAVPEAGRRPAGDGPASLLTVGPRGGGAVIVGGSSFSSLSSTRPEAAGGAQGAGAGVVGGMGADARMLGSRPVAASALAGDRGRGRLRVRGEGKQRQRGRGDRGGRRRRKAGTALGAFRPGEWNGVLGGANGDSDGEGSSGDVDDDALNAPVRLVPLSQSVLPQALPVRPGGGSQGALRHPGAPTPAPAAAAIVGVTGVTGVAAERGRGLGARRGVRALQPLALASLGLVPTPPPVPGTTGATATPAGGGGRAGGMEPSHVVTARDVATLALGPRGAGPRGRRTALLQPQRVGAPVSRAPGDSDGDAEEEPGTPDEEVRVCGPLPRTPVDMFTFASAHTRLHGNA